MKNNDIGIVSELLYPATTNEEFCVRKSSYRTIISSPQGRMIDCIYHAEALQAPAYPRSLW